MTYKLRFYKLKQLHFGRYLIFITAAMWSVIVPMPCPLSSPCPRACYLCCPLDGGCIDTVEEISRCWLITLMNYLRRSRSWARAAGQLGRCWPRYIKLRLILVSCYGSRTNGQTGHGCRPHAQLLSPHLAASTSQYKYFAWWRWHPWKWCEILDSSTDSRQETGLGKYLPTDCAMCNVNNVLLTAAWPLDSWEVFTSRNVVCSLATAAVCYPLSGPRTILAGTQWSDGSVVSTSSGVRENSRIKHRWNLVDDMCRYCRYPTVYPEDRPSNYVI